jgi:hypothetical protein
MLAALLNPSSYISSAQWPLVANSCHVEQFRSRRGNPETKSRNKFLRRSKEGNKFLIQVIGNENEEKGTDCQVAKFFLVSLFLKSGYNIYYPW